MTKQTRIPQNYNATVIYTDASGEVYCHQLVQLEGSKVVAAAGHWTHNNGTLAFHQDWKMGKDSTLRMGGEGSTHCIHCDDGAAYKAKVASMGMF